MWVERAVFTSSKTRHAEGYQIVAKSPGVTGGVVTALHRWCPSHAALQSTDPHAESLNFHPIDDERVAISRTTYGRKEFSRRGGLQVATIVFVLQQQQLSGFGNDAFLFARAARALGYLRWKPHFPEQLPALELPSSAVAERLDETNDDATPFVDLLHSGERLAIHWSGDPNQLIGGLMQRLSPEERITAYFTTGLKWSKQRPFSLHCFETIDDTTRLRLKADGVRIVNPQNTLSKG